MATTSSTSARASGKRDRAPYRCTECGWESLRWVGRCGECQAWGSVEGADATPAGAMVPTRVAEPAAPITAISADQARRRPTGLAEVDRVLGDGLVAGSVVLLAGEPGVGKSTLLLALAAEGARAGRRILYVSGEESTGQVRMRAERMGALEDRLFLAGETDLGRVLGQVEAIAPEVLIVDSVQTISSSAVDGTAGGVTQVRTVAAALTHVAKSRGLATILVGHVTKDGSVAGPRTLEHIVDVVLQVEGERHASLRMLRAVKNRFGAVDEVGCFELTDAGIVELPDPSGLFLTRRAQPTPGTAVTVTLEGRRPLVVEVQALVGSASTGSGRRTAVGMDSGRVAMVAAVVERRAGIRMGSADAYTATVGGVRLSEPAADLAVSLALATAVMDHALPSGLVAVGEVGLAGDVRGVPAITRRLREAQRLGFGHALVPPSYADDDCGLTLHRVDTVRDALNLALRLDTGYDKAKVAGGLSTARLRPTT